MTQAVSPAADPIKSAIHALVDLGVYLRTAAKDGVSESDISTLLRDQALLTELANTMDSMKAVEAEAQTLTHSPMAMFGLVGPLVSELGRLFA